MADNPAWFDEEFYLRSKLNQLQVDESDADWDMEGLVDAIANAGLTPFTHFQSYSLIERTSPNPFFNAHEYLHAKLRQLEEDESGQYADIDAVAEAIDSAGMSLWEHFQTYGWKEGVNPSNSFDIDGYFEAKLAELERTDSEGDWDMQKVKDAFADAGLDPISHYESYGRDEEVTPVEVPEEDRVDPDPNPVDPGPDPTFTVSNTAGTISFAGDATGEISLNGEGNNISFQREGVSDAWEDAMLQDVQHITLEDDSPFTFKDVNLSYPQFPDESDGGSPRLWLDYTSTVTTASLKLDGVINKAAIGVTGANLTELNISGGFVGENEDGWHQLQLWDGDPNGATGLPALETITLAMTSDTDLGAYPPLGVLTHPTTLDASASTGALKITPAGAPIELGWAEVSTGSGDDVLAFDGGQVKDWLNIDAGDGNDSIEFGINTTVTGGAGNDTFIITAPAGTGSPTEQMFITDYGNGADVIDLTQVEGLQLDGPDGDRLEIHQGGKTGDGWGDTPQGTENDVLIQLSGGSGSQLIVEGAYAEGTTIAMQVTRDQAGLLDNPDDVVDFLANITEGGEIDASAYTNDAILSGGSGNQTLISGKGNDFLQGGSGTDTFVFNEAFGQDAILDFDQSEGDQIDVSAFAAIKDAITFSQESDGTSFNIGGNTLLVLGATLKIDDLYFGA